MSPDTTRSDHPQVARGEAELAHEIDALLSRCVAPADFENLLLRESDFAVGGATCSTAAAFRAHIGKIVRLRSKKQVVWPHTRRGVTAVEHAHLVWNRAVMQFPRYAMRVELSAPDNDQSVPVSVGVGLPQPTPIGLVDLRPEPINQGHSDKSSGRGVSLHGWPYVISRTPHGYVNEGGPTWPEARGVSLRNPSAWLSAATGPSRRRVLVDRDQARECPTPTPRRGRNRSATMAKNGHRTSHPNPTGPIRSAGGATFAVKDNANVRADGIGTPPVRNAGPVNNAPFPPSNPPTRGGRKVPGG